MSIDEFNHIFYPRSVAIIGASPDFKRLGYHCMLSLIKGRFEGRIYPVHPSLPEISGFKAYPSIKAIPDKIDLAIIAVRASLVPSLLRECAEEGVKGVVLITAGFKEIEDKTGAELQTEIATIANQAGIKIIGPNTFGIVNLPANLNASFTPEFSLTPKGSISLVSQSGGFCHLIAPLAMSEHVGLSKIIGLGNRCNVEFADMLAYLAEDRDTKVIMMFIEGTDHARELFKVAGEVSKRKPIVALKAGRFRLKDKAAYSHTGSLAGDYEIYSAAFEQSGIIKANNSTELLDIAKALASYPLPKSNKIAVLSAQAGPAIIASDVCEREGLILAELSTETRHKVEELLPPLSMRANPIDMGPAWYDPETQKKVIEAVLADEDVAGMVLYAAYASANIALLEGIADLLRPQAQEKPIIPCFPSPTGIWVEEKRRFEEKGIALYPTPERAAKALASLVKRAEFLRGS